MFLWKFVEFKIILQMLSIWSRITQTQDFLTNCDIFYNNSCFNYIKFPNKDWSDANTDCVTRGGYLTSINSENENDMLASLLRQNYGYTGKNAWIGLDYNSYMQSTQWVDGNPITYSSTPDKSGTSPHCIVITDTGNWRAFSCRDRREYICRKPRGSLFAIKMDSGQYESIDGFNKTINSIPTTLVCRTDTYQTTQITWEYKPTQNEQWTDVQGSWDVTTGISELNISNYGYYRCHVKSGGSDLTYTATAINPTITTQITTGSKYSTTDLLANITNIQTTLPLVSSTTVFRTKEMEVYAGYLSLPKYQAILGGIIALIVFLIGIIVGLVSIIIILLLYARKRRQRVPQFQRIPKNDERPRYENITDIKHGNEIKERNSNKFNRIEILPTNEYFNLSDVTNQSSAVVIQDSDDYTTMLGVGNQDINLANKSSHYENRPEFDYINSSEVSMDGVEGPSPGTMT